MRIGYSQVIGFGGKRVPEYSTIPYVKVQLIIGITIITRVQKKFTG